MSTTRRQIPDFPAYWLDPQGRVFRSVQRAGGQHYLDLVPVYDGRVILKAGTKALAVSTQSLVRQVFADLFETEQDAVPEKSAADGLASEGTGFTVEETGAAPRGRKRRRKRRKSPQDADSEDDKE